MQKTLKSHGTWVGKWTFVLAATGSAVGLGNIWGFPYKAGTEVVAHLFFIFFVYYFNWITYYVE